MSETKPFSVREGFAPQALHMSNLETLHRIWGAIYGRVNFDDSLRVLQEVFAVSVSLLHDMRNKCQAIDTASPLPPDFEFLVEGLGDLETRKYARETEKQWRTKQRDAYEAFVRKGIESFWADAHKKGKWFRFYDLCEFLIANGSQGQRIAADIEGTLDSMGNAGCRLVDGKFVPDLSREEGEEIQQARRTPFAEARMHIKKAVSLFSNRNDPDHANSIKESISAVESLVKEFTGKEMGPGLNALQRNGFFPHPAFAEALKKHYGFTSDAGGIRHAADGKSVEPDANTARFILATCAAFINYMSARKAAPVKD